jgi:phosphomannomutase/phosphoglucomutase
VPAMPSVPAEIFKAYDIRGIVGKTLTPEIAELVGRAIGTRARTLEQKAVCIGRDGRLSGPALSAALARGLQAAGVDVIDVGCVATPMLYFATHHLQTGSGVMVTGSHNPPDYNGMKIVVAGETLSGEAIQELRKRIEGNELATGNGHCSQIDVAQAYFERIVADVKLTRPMRIAVDCGNGVAGAFAPELYRRLGCRVRELYCEVDATGKSPGPDSCAGRRGR